MMWSVLEIRKLETEVCEDYDYQHINAHLIRSMDQSLATMDQEHGCLVTRIKHGCEAKRFLHRIGDVPVEVGQLLPREGVGVAGGVASH